MSYKIVDTIKKLKGMPRKYKSVLEAWASFASKDGTGIRPSKEKVAERAGIARCTVYRNTEDLVTFGVLVPTGTHNYGNGHWVTVYKIDMVKLLETNWDTTVATSQFATLQEPDQCSKTPKVQCSKTPNSNVAKRHAILPLTPAALTPKNPSAVSTAVKEGRKEEVIASLAPLTRNSRGEDDESFSLEHEKEAWTIYDAVRGHMNYYGNEKVNELKAASLCWVVCDAMEISMEKLLTMVAWNHNRMADIPKRCLRKPSSLFKTLQSGKLLQHYEDALAGKGKTWRAPKYCRHSKTRHIRGHINECIMCGNLIEDDAEDTPKLTMDMADDDDIRQGEGFNMDEDDDE